MDHYDPYVPAYLKKGYQGPPESPPSSQDNRKVQHTQYRETTYRPRSRTPYAVDRASDSELSDDGYSDDDRHARSRRRSVDDRLVRRRQYPEDDGLVRSQHRSRARSSRREPSRRGRSSTRDREHEREPSESYTVAKALKSAAAAAVVESIRCRHEPGPWGGQKGKRVATAAVTGALYGTLRNGKLKKSGKLPIADAAVSGIYAVDFLKRVCRQTEHEKGAEEERRKRRDSWSDDEDDRRR